MLAILKLIISSIHKQNFQTQIKQLRSFAFQKLYTFYGQVWRITENSYEEWPEACYGAFYSAEAFIVRWGYRVMQGKESRSTLSKLSHILESDRDMSDTVTDNLNVRHLIAGGKKAEHDTGRDRTCYFFWQGLDCSTKDKGTVQKSTV